jgi:lysophospholipase L1-like esterase
MIAVLSRATPATGLGPGLCRGLALALAMALGSAACGDDTPTTPTQPTIPPLTLTCPAHILGQSTTGAPVSIQVPAPTVTGGVFPFTISCAPTGTPFPVGTTRVSCSATDGQGATASCSYDVVVAPPPLPRTSFLAFGDSMTEGEITVPTTGALDAGGFPQFRLVVVPTESYPTELLRLLRARYVTQSAQFVVTNAGMSREWAADGPKRFPQTLAASGAQVVLLLEGANDLSARGAQGLGPALNGLQSMVRSARGAGATVFIASIPPPKPSGSRALPIQLVTALNDGIRLGAAGEGAIFVDIYAALATNVEQFIGADGLHPTEAGYQRMADTFFAAIRVFEGR